MCYQGYFPKLFTGIPISILMTQDLVMQSNGWKIPMIRLQISVWTVALKARELLTGCLRKNTWSHRVSIVENYMKIWKKWFYKKIISNIMWILEFEIFKWGRWSFKTSNNIWKWTITTKLIYSNVIEILLYTT